MDARAVIVLAGAIALFVAAFWGYFGPRGEGFQVWSGFHPGWLGAFVAYLLVFYIK
jgi:hypothetical protein